MWLILVTFGIVGAWSNLKALDKNLPTPSRIATYLPASQRQAQAAAGTTGKIGYVSVNVGTV